MHGRSRRRTSEPLGAGHGARRALAIPRDASPTGGRSGQGTRSLWTGAGSGAGSGWRPLSALLALALLAPSASAQPAVETPAPPVVAGAGSATLPDAPPLVGDETIVIVEGGAAADGVAAPHRQRALGAAPFVTIVERADRRGELLSVAEAISATVGTSVRSTGGVGASALLSIRGASAGHTSVLVDGVAMSRLTSSSVDLGRFRLDELDAVEIYRGNVPAELGGAGVGGAVNLVTHLGRGRAGERLRVIAGAGSFGAQLLAARVGDRVGDYDVSASAGTLASDGDYRAYSDAGTPLNRDDDTWLTRRNNASRQLDVSLRAGTAPSSTAPGVRDGEHASVAGVRLSWQRHGLPGLIAAPAEHAALSTAFGMADVDLRRQHAGWAVRHRGWASAEWQRFRDRDDEIGLAAQDREHLTLGAGAASFWKRRFGGHLAEAGAELRVERFRDRDRWMDGPTAFGARQTIGLSIGDELADAEWLVAAALRLEVSRTAPAELPDAPSMPLSPRYEVLPSPRVTARVLAERDLALKASAGWYARQPTLTELFGDRGFIVGSPELKAESGPSFDLGLVWSPARASGPVDRTMIELAGFFNRASDAIIYVNTGFVTRPLNAGAAQNVGLEAAASTRLLRAVQLIANYTLQVSEQLEEEPSYNGKDLPRHPRHALYGRVEAQQDLLDHQLRGWADLHWTAQSFLDRAGLQRVPPRQSVGVGGAVELGLGLVLSVEVKNLLDRQIEHLELDPPPRPDLTTTPVAISDLSGLPLPGRHVFVSLEWSR